MHVFGGKMEDNFATHSDSRFECVDNQCKRNK
jgi:hypothetical protein